MPDLIPFQYESQQVRVIRDDFGNPWFVAKDVCDVLGFMDVQGAREDQGCFGEEVNETICDSKG